MNEIILQAPINKEESNFDLLYLAYSSLLKEFSEEYLERNKIIPVKKIYQFFGVNFHFKKEFTKELLKALPSRYPIEFKQHGIRINKIMR